MAFTLVTSMHEPGVSGVATTSAGISTTGCDFLVAVVGGYIAAGDPALTDNQSNTWGNLTKRETAVVAEITIFYTTNYPANTHGSNHTFTFGGTGTSYPMIALLGFSGARSSSVFDTGKDSGAIGNLPLQPGSLTPSEDDCLVIAGIAHNTPVESPTINGGFSSPVVELQNAGNCVGGAIAYLIQTTAAAANPTWSGSIGDAAISMGVFRAQPAGGGGSLARTRLRRVA